MNDDERLRDFESLTPEEQHETLKKLNHFFDGYYGYADEKALMAIKEDSENFAPYQRGLALGELNKIATNREHEWRRRQNVVTIFGFFLGAFLTSALNALVSYCL